MRSIALRDFQQKGPSALGTKVDEPVLLRGRAGPSYFLVPADQDHLETQFTELERAMALSNLRSWQLRARELGLDQMTAEDIDQEIAVARKERKKKAAR